MKKVTSKRVKVAVYGTLRLPSHSMMRKAKFLDYDVIEGMELVGGVIPFMQEGHGDTFVEVYEMSEEDLRPITRMEIGAGYDAVQVRTKKGHEAEAYVFPTTKLRLDSYIGVIERGEGKRPLYYYNYLPVLTKEDL